MKIHKQSVSDYLINDKIRMSKLNVVGITFARFRLQSVTKKDGYYLANIEIINDDISKDIELSLTKKKQF
jgi:hypothetical protein